jgi:hypothetical protein
LNQLLSCLKKKCRLSTIGSMKFHFPGPREISLGISPMEVNLFWFISFPLVLVAEIVKHFVPHIVELHNYSAAHSVSQKTYNWNTLNQKLFKKLGFTLTKRDMEDAVNCVPDTIERILRVL